jgi:hypothetical protein
MEDWLAITDILRDVVTLGLPTRVILKLMMRSENKWALAGVFAIGSVAVIAGAIRLIYALQFRHITSTPPRDASISNLVSHLITYNQGAIARTL